MLLELVELLTTLPSFSSPPPPHPRFPPTFYKHLHFSRTYIPISYTMKHTLSTQTHKTHAYTATQPFHVCLSSSLPSSFLPTNLVSPLSAPSSSSSSSSCSQPQIPLHVLVVLVVGCMEKAASKSFFHSVKKIKTKNKKRVLILTFSNKSPSLHVHHSWNMLEDFLQVLSKTYYL